MFASGSDSVIVKIRIKFNRVNRRVISLLTFNNVSEYKFYNYIDFLKRFISIILRARLIVRSLIVKRLQNLLHFI